jgi:hypothetical protein
VTAETIQMVDVLVTIAMSETIEIIEVLVTIATLEEIAISNGRDDSNVSYK